MWFKSETNLATIIELLRVVIDELKKKPYELKGQVVSARLEMSPKRKPLAKESSCVVLQRHQKQGRRSVAILAQEAGVFASNVCCPLRGATTSE